MSLIQKGNDEPTYGRNSERRFASISRTIRIFRRHETASWRLRHARKSTASAQIHLQMIGNGHNLVHVRTKVLELRKEVTRAKSVAITRRLRIAIALLSPDLQSDVSTVG
jgi:hypothetical protein